MQQRVSFGIEKLEEEDYDTYTYFTEDNMKVFNTGTGLVCLYSMADLGRALGSTVQYVHRRIRVEATLPAPTHLSGKKRYYTEAEYQKIIADEVKRKEMLGR